MAGVEAAGGSNTNDAAEEAKRRQEEEARRKEQEAEADEAADSSDSATKKNDETNDSASEKIDSTKDSTEANNQDSLEESDTLDSTSKQNQAREIKNDPSVDQGNEAVRPSAESLERSTQQLERTREKLRQERERRSGSSNSQDPRLAMQRLARESQVKSDRSTEEELSLRLDQQAKAIEEKKIEDGKKSEKKIAAKEKEIEAQSEKTQKALALLESKSKDSIKTTQALKTQQEAQTREAELKKELGKRKDQAKEATRQSLQISEAQKLMQAGDSQGAQAVLDGESYQTKRSISLSLKDFDPSKIAADASPDQRAKEIASTYRQNINSNNEAVKAFVAAQREKINGLEATLTDKTKTAEERATAAKLHTELSQKQVEMTRQLDMMQQYQEQVTQMLDTGDYEGIQALAEGKAELEVTEDFNNPEKEKEVIAKEKALIAEEQKLADQISELEADKEKLAEKRIEDGKEAEKEVQKEIAKINKDKAATKEAKAFLARDARPARGTQSRVRSRGSYKSKKRNAAAVKRQFDQRVSNIGRELTKRANEVTESAKKETQITEAQRLIEAGKTEAAQKVLEGKTHQESQEINIGLEGFDASKIATDASPEEREKAIAQAYREKVGEATAQLKAFVKVQKEKLDLQKRVMRATETSSQERAGAAEAYSELSTIQADLVRQLDQMQQYQEQITDMEDAGNFAEMREIAEGERKLEVTASYNSQEKEREVLEKENKLSNTEAKERIKKLMDENKIHYKRASTLSNSIVREMQQSAQDIKDMGPLAAGFYAAGDFLADFELDSLKGIEASGTRAKDLAQTASAALEGQREALQLMREGKFREAVASLEDTNKFLENNFNANLRARARDSAKYEGSISSDIEKTINTSKAVGVGVVAAGVTIVTAGLATPLTGSVLAATAIGVTAGTAAGTAAGFAANLAIDSEIAGGVKGKDTGEWISGAFETAIKEDLQTAFMASLAAAGGSLGAASLEAGVAARLGTKVGADLMKALSPQAQKVLMLSKSAVAGTSSAAPGVVKDVFDKTAQRAKIAASMKAEGKTQEEIEAELKRQNLDTGSIFRTAAINLGAGGVSGLVGGQTEIFRGATSSMRNKMLLTAAEELVNLGVAVGETTVTVDPNNSEEFASQLMSNVQGALIASMQGAYEIRSSTRAQAKAEAELAKARQADIQAETAQSRNTRESAEGTEADAQAPDIEIENDTDVENRQEIDDAMTAEIKSDEEDGENPFATKANETKTSEESQRETKGSGKTKAKDSVQELKSKIEAAASEKRKAKRDKGDGNQSNNFDDWLKEYGYDEVLDQLSGDEQAEYRKELEEKAQLEFKEDIETGDIETGGEEELSEGGSEEEILDDENTITLEGRIAETSDPEAAAESEVTKTQNDEAETTSFGRIKKLFGLTSSNKEKPVKTEKVKIDNGADYGRVKFNAKRNEYDDGSAVYDFSSKPLSKQYVDKSSIAKHGGTERALSAVLEHIKNNDPDAKIKLHEDDYKALEGASIDRSDIDKILPGADGSAVLPINSSYAKFTKAKIDENGNLNLKDLEIEQAAEILEGLNDYKRDDSNDIAIENEIKSIDLTAEQLKSFASKKESEFNGSNRYEPPKDIVTAMSKRNFDRIDSKVIEEAGLHPLHYTDEKGLAQVVLTNNKPTLDEQGRQVLTINSHNTHGIGRYGINYNASALGSALSQFVTDGGVIKAAPEVASRLSGPDFVFDNKTIPTRHGDEYLASEKPIKGDYGIDNEVTIRKADYSMAETDQSSRKTDSTEIATSTSTKEKDLVARLKNFANYKTIEDIVKVKKHNSGSTNPETDAVLRNLPVEMHKTLNNAFQLYKETNASGTEKRITDGEHTVILNSGGEAQFSATILNKDGEALSSIAISYNKNEEIASYKLYAFPEGGAQTGDRESHRGYLFEFSPIKTDSVEKLAGDPNDPSTALSSVLSGKDYEGANWGEDYGEPSFEIRPMSGYGSTMGYYRQKLSELHSETRPEASAGDIEQSRTRHNSDNDSGEVIAESRVAANEEDVSRSSNTDDPEHALYDDMKAHEEKDQQNPLSNDSMVDDGDTLIPGSKEEIEFRAKVEKEKAEIIANDRKRLASLDSSIDPREALKDIESRPEIEQRQILYALAQKRLQELNLPPSLIDNIIRKEGEWGENGDLSITDRGGVITAKDHIITQKPEDIEGFINHEISHLKSSLDLETINLNDPHAATKLKEEEMQNYVEGGDLALEGTQQREYKPSRKDYGLHENSEVQRVLDDSKKEIIDSIKAKRETNQEDADASQITKDYDYEALAKRLEEQGLDAQEAKKLKDKFKEEIEEAAERIKNNSISQHALKAKFDKSKVKGARSAIQQTTIQNLAKRRKANLKKSKKKLTDTQRDKSHTDHFDTYINQKDEIIARRRDFAAHEKSLLRQHPELKDTITKLSTEEKKELGAPSNNATKERIASLEGGEEFIANRTDLQHEVTRDKLTTELTKENRDYAAIEKLANRVIDYHNHFVDLNEKARANREPLPIGTAIHRFSNVDALHNIRFNAQVQQLIQERGLTKPSAHEAKAILSKEYGDYEKRLDSFLEASEEQKDRVGYAASSAENRKGMSDEVIDKQLNLYMAIEEYKKGLREDSLDQKFNENGDSSIDRLGYNMFSNEGPYDIDAGIQRLEKNFELGTLDNIKQELKSLQKQELSAEQRKGIDQIFKQRQKGGYRNIEIMTRLAQLAEPDNAQLQQAAADQAATNFYENGRGGSMQKYFDEDLQPRVEAETAKLKELLGADASDAEITQQLKELELLANEKAGVMSGHVMNTFADGVEPGEVLNRFYNDDVQRAREDVTDFDADARETAQELLDLLSPDDNGPRDEDNEFDTIFNMDPIDDEGPETVILDPIEQEEHRNSLEARLKEQNEKLKQQREEIKNLDPSIDPHNAIKDISSKSELEQKQIIYALAQEKMKQAGLPPESLSDIQIIDSKKTNGRLSKNDEGASIAISKQRLNGKPEDIINTINHEVSHLRTAIEAETIALNDPHKETALKEQAMQDYIEGKDFALEESVDKSFKPKREDFGLHEDKATQKAIDDSKKAALERMKKAVIEADSKGEKIDAEKYLEDLKASEDFKAIDELDISNDEKTKLKRKLEGKMSFEAKRQKTNPIAQHALKREINKKSEELTRAKIQQDTINRLTNEQLDQIEAVKTKVAAGEKLSSKEKHVYDEQFSLYANQQDEITARRQGLAAKEKEILANNPELKQFLQGLAKQNNRDSMKNARQTNDIKKRLEAAGLPETQVQEKLDVVRKALQQASQSKKKADINSAEVRKKISEIAGGKEFISNRKAIQYESTREQLAKTLNKTDAESRAKQKQLAQKLLKMNKDFKENGMPSGVKLNTKNDRLREIIDDADLAQRAENLGIKAPDTAKEAREIIRANDEVDQYSTQTIQDIRSEKAKLADKTDEKSVRTYLALDRRAKDIREKALDGEYKARVRTLEESSDPLDQDYVDSGEIDLNDSQTIDDVGQEERKLIEDNLDTIRSYDDIEGARESLDLIDDLETRAQVESALDSLEEKMVQFEMDTQVKEITENSNILKNKYNADQAKQTIAKAKSIKGLKAKAEKFEKLVDLTKKKNDLDKTSFADPEEKVRKKKKYENEIAALTRPVTAEKDPNVISNKQAREAEAIKERNRVIDETIATAKEELTKDERSVLEAVKASNDAGTSTEDLFYRAVQELGLSDKAHELFRSIHKKLPKSEEIQFSKEFGDIGTHGKIHQGSLENSISQLSETINPIEGNKAQVDSILSEFENETERSIAQEVLGQLTQFANINGLSNITMTKPSSAAGETRPNLQNTSFITISEAALVNTLKYFDRKGLIDSKASGQALDLVRTKIPEKLGDALVGVEARKDSFSLLVDSETLKQLESQPEALGILNQKANARTGKGLNLVIMEGWEQGNNIVQQRDLKQETQRYTHEAQKLMQEEGLSQSEAIQKAMYGDIEERLAKLGAKEKNISYLSSKQKNVESSDDIAKNLSASNKTEEEITRDIVSKIDPKATGDRRDRLEGAVGEILRKATVVSPQKFSEAIADMKQQLETLAKRKGVDVKDLYFYSPKGSMANNQTQKQSMTMMASIMAKELGIDSSQIITKREDLSTLADSSQLVILDDFSGSGKTLAELHQEASQRHTGDIAVAPLFATQDAINKIYENLGGDEILTHQELQSMSESSYFDSLSSTDQKLLLSTMGKAGFDDSGTSILMPYMAPNNNDAFTNMVLGTILLPGAAIKKNGENQDRFVIK